MEYLRLQYMSTSDHIPFFWQTVSPNPSCTVLIPHVYTAMSPSNVPVEVSTVARGMSGGWLQLAEKKIYRYIKTVLKNTSFQPTYHENLSLFFRISFNFGDAILTYVCNRIWRQTSVHRSRRLHWFLPPWLSLLYIGSTWWILPEWFHQRPLPLFPPLVQGHSPLQLARIEN